MATVMFIDDNADTLELMQRSISMLGHQAICCCDEKIAFQAIWENLPDLIFVDLGLQNINGLSVLQNLKANPVTTSIPVIVVSAGSSPQDRVDAFAAGAIGFLEKPIRFDDLTAVFEKFLEKPHE